MARLYDLMLLIDPNAPEERRTAAISEAESLIGSGGELVDSHDWGTRRMAFEIDHRPEADYRLYQFTGDNALLQRLNQRLRILDAVLRFRIIKQKPGMPTPPPPEPISDSASEIAAVRRSSGALGSIRSMRSYSRAIERGRLAAELRPGRGEGASRSAFPRSGLARSSALEERGVACPGGRCRRAGGDERERRRPGAGGRWGASDAHAPCGSRGESAVAPEAS